MKVNEYIKKGFICLMLIAYVFGVLKPLSPLIKDFVAHTFDQANHMATIHFENGKYHVHKELAVEQNLSDTKKNAAETFSPEELLANHLQSSSYKFNAYYTQTSVISTETDTRFPDIFFK